jgi:hypothetical protein
MLNAIKTVSSLALITLSLSACGGKNDGSKFLTFADVSVSTQGNNSFINMTGVLDLGNATMVEINGQIVDPTTKITIGSIDLTQLPAGKTQVHLTVNATAITHGDAAMGRTLPNDKPLPFSLSANDGDVLAIPIFTNSRIYLGGALSSHIIAGVALTINGFDQVIDHLGAPANVFFMVPFTPNISGIAGVYATPDRLKSGIAVFGKWVKNPTQMAIEQNDEVAKEKDLADLKLIDNETKSRLMDYFYGEEKELEVY